MKARPPEVIAHGPVTLYRSRPADLDTLLQVTAASADHLRPWLPWAGELDPETEAAFLRQAEFEWDDGTAFHYKITAGGALAGGISLMARIGVGGLEIGYWIRQDRTRRGLATAATAALVAQAFRLPGVDRVEIVHDELNLASGGIPRKLGFTEVGRRPIDPPAPGGTGIGVVWRLVR